MGKKKTDSTSNNEWYTPKFIIDWVNDFSLNGIDLDPFSNAKANETVQAKRFFTKEMDAFSIKDWRNEEKKRIGLIFANIPYLPSSLAQRSVLRLIEEYNLNHVDEIIILSHNPVDTKMFEYLAEAGTVAFSKGRVSFIDGKTMRPKDNPGSGHILTYIGRHTQHFIESVENMYIPEEFSRLRGWLVPNKP